MSHFMVGMGKRETGWLIMCVDRHSTSAFNHTEPELAHDDHNRFVRVVLRLGSCESDVPA